MISACLLGVACNHEGRGSPRAVVDELARHYRLVPVCPEVLGGLPARDLAELVGEPLEEEDITTTSGWVTHRLGGFPKLEDTLMLGRFKLKVEEMDGPRVARLMLKRVEAQNVNQAASDKAE